MCIKGVFAWKIYLLLACLLCFALIRFKTNKINQKRNPVNKIKILKCFSSSFVYNFIMIIIICIHYHHHRFSCYVILNKIKKQLCCCLFDDCFSNHIIIRLVWNDHHLLFFFNSLAVFQLLFFTWKLNWQKQIWFCKMNQVFSIKINKQQQSVNVKPEFETETLLTKKF